MKQKINWIIQNFDNIYILFLFLISLLIVLFLFPAKGKFKYEFQKGQPWMHEDFVAPFDFAVTKLNNEIKEEKQQIKENFSPYFKYDKEVAQKQIELFTNKYSKTIKELQLKNNKNTLNVNFDSIDFYFNKTKKTLQKIYKAGIIDYNEDYEVNNTHPISINIVKNKIANKIDYKNIYTLKSAYNFLIKEFNNSKFNNKENNNSLQISNLNINVFLRPNLYYDKINSDNVLKEQLDNISLTRGMVQEGERIIYKGEVVDSEKFRVLESLRSIFLSSQIDNNKNHSILLVGHLIIILFAFLMVYLFMNIYRKEVLLSRKKTLFILLMIITAIFLSKIVYEIEVLSIYVIPFAIFPIIINTFFDSRLSLFIHFITILLAAFFAPNSFEFILLQFNAGVVATIGLKKLQNRSQFFSSSILTILTYFFVYLGIAINHEGNIKNIEWINFAWFLANGILLLLSYPLIYAFERIFKFLSNVTLMEISDTNQALLKELSEKAPGTFQHSMQVANLAEEAIRCIDGDALLVRAGALYHDIGKLSNPIYFTENQIAGRNPHDNLDYIESAEIIINHISAGVEIAKKAKLPKQIIDFIQTHHGTTKTQYFYRLYKKENPKKVNIEKLFTYPGKKPFSKETAVLMMADAIEAASKSIKDITYDKINNLVNGIIETKINENQFNETNITFLEISEVKKVFKEKLQNIYHARIEYPKEE